MKKIIILLLMSIFVTSCKSSWNLYKPVQSEIIGKKVLDYNKKSQEIALGTINTTTGKVNTKDNTSTSSEKLEIEKNMTLDLKGFFNKKTKVTEVDVTNAIVTNISSIKDLNPGKFIYSAIKADKVIVTLKNESETEIKPKELIDQMESYVKALNPALADVAGIVNEISFDSKNESKYVINNPKVYYLFQEAELFENQGNLNKWFQNFTRDGNIKLTQTEPISKIINPVISKSFKDKVDRISVQLVRKMENNKPELYVRYSTKLGNELKKIPRFSNKIWDELNFIIKEYDLSSNSYKVVRMDIKAQQIESDILVTLGKVSYPEKILKINKY